jgi:hypothetical protein
MFVNKFYTKSLNFSRLALKYNSKSLGGSGVGVGDKAYRD